MTRFTHTRCASRHRRGVTLVEVLATLVLIGIVLPVAMRGATLSMQTAARARHMTEAAHLADLKLAEIAVVNNISLYSGSGDFGEEWPEYRWISESQPADFGLYSLTVSVVWTEQGQERATSLSTLLYPAEATTLQ